MNPTIDLSTPPVLDLEALLVPIPGDNPSGQSIRYELIYDEIREARRSEDDTEQGAWQRDTKTADWDQVVALGTRCLIEKTKDLQIAAWITEALGHLHGFAGLRDGLTLLHGIQDRFWDTYFPEIDDGDLESRVGPFLFLNDSKLLPFLIRSIPLTDFEERYNYLSFKQSRDTENALLKKPDKEKEILAGGKIRAEQFDKEVAATSRRFYERTVADLKGAKAAFETFDQGTDARFGRDAPSLLNVRQALDDCLRLLEPILQDKRQSEPDPELDAPPPSEAPPIEAGVDADAPALDSATDGATSPGSTATADAASAVADYGRVLIEFQQRAQELAEAGNRLKENRERYAELQGQLRDLDRAYEEISRQVSRSQDFYQHLARLLKLPGS